MSETADFIIAGAAGRMGQMLLKEVLNTPHARLVGALVSPHSLLKGQDVGKSLGQSDLGVCYTDDPLAVMARKTRCIVIDFSTQQAALNYGALAAQAGFVYVLGVTGFDSQARQQIERFSHHCPLIEAANFSMGILLLKALAKLSTKLLGEDFDIEIVEMHHRNKIDAPSGTALALGAAVAEAAGWNHEAVRRDVRSGVMGQRPRQEIGYATLRGGDVVGEHTVIFAGEGERISLSHQASSRQIFAKGAVRAGLWGLSQKAGHYSLENVMGL